MNLPVALQILEKLKGGETLNCSFVAIRIRMGPKLEPQPTRTIIFHFSFTEHILVNVYKTSIFQVLMATHELYTYISTYVALNTHKIHRE